MGADPFVGVDVKLRNGDLGFTQLGDLDLVGDKDPIDNIWQAVTLRLTTIRGKNFFVDKFGSVLGTYVDEPLTTDLNNRIEADAKRAILEDPRVASVSNFKAIQGASGITLTFTITTASGRSKSGSVTL